MLRQLLCLRVYPPTQMHPRFWQVVDKHQVNIFYTAPTAIRALMAVGDEPVKATSRSSLRLLGSVGEPINQRHGNGISESSEMVVALSLTPGGRQKRDP